MKRFAVPIAMLLATTACTTTQRVADGSDLASSAAPVAPILTSAQAIDEESWAEPQKARVTHVALDLDLDFARQRVAGTATLDVMAKPGVSEIVLDDRGLQISSITDGAGRMLEWSVGAAAEGEKGAPLTIGLDGARKVQISYAASEADALQWLDPEQTAGGQHPFLFSQGQAILNRTWIPTQDSPGIRQTWEARITAPKPLDVVMSGVRQGEPEDLGDGRRVFHFVMDKPVPPYLIAIAAGDIDFKAIGPRTGVWAEPSVLPRAYAEVADTEEMVVAAEELYGEYRWGRYDMIVLPPAFPYGGMENPVMTFLTPTFIAGDRSNNGLVAHELAHSWSGNLVTYASWRDGWLNEGVTSYIENRISEEVYGKARAEQEYALSYAALEAMVAEQGATNPVTAMRTPAGTSPFDTAGEAIYDKGTVFLRTVENIIGRQRFDAWLTQWFDNHAFQPATSAMFLADLREKLVRGDRQLEQRLLLDQWVYGTGLPANALKPDAQAFAAVDAAVTAYAANRSLPTAAAWRAWTAAEQRRFLEELPEALSAGDLAALDKRLGVSASGNNEVRFLWLEAALRNRYQPAVPQAEEFLARVGRNKFVSPLFQALWNTGEWGQPIARRIYADTRGGYHAYTRGKVDAIVS